MKSPSFEAPVPARWLNVLSTHTNSAGRALRIITRNPRQRYKKTAVFKRACASGLLPPSPAHPFHLLETWSFFGRPPASRRDCGPGRADCLRARRALCVFGRLRKLAGWPEPRRDPAPPAVSRLGFGWLQNLLPRNNRDFQQKTHRHSDKEEVLFLDEGGL